MSVLETLLGDYVELKLVVAHAARADKHVSLSSTDTGTAIVPATTYNGVKLNPTDFFVVRASGNSLVDYGVINGARLVAHFVNDDNRNKIAPGAIVLVEDEAKGSNVNGRLRVVDRLIGDTAYFLPDKEGRPHKPRLATTISGVITHHLAS